TAPADGTADATADATTPADGTAGTPAGAAESGSSSNLRGYEPSSAGAGHEVDASRFRTKTKTVRVNGRKRTIKLRHKLPEPKLLRNTRTGEYIDPKELQKKQKNK
ncbi:MAG TPA: hypothetical protein H9862_07620, partial [Candidatus Akkermansia intestinigallinarum]|nr:hypothetical protein [Candidatus Akkermansia intestinigallinarum]